MDESKPPTPSSEFRFRSASQRTSAGIDLPSAKAAELAAVERQSRSGQVEPCQDSDEPSAAVYYRNEEEVSRGFLIAFSAMGVAVVEQLPQPAKPPIGKAKP